MLIQRLVKFPTAVTRKSLIIWICLMDQWKAERVLIQNSIRDIWCFSQSETEN
jgi:hypothetical protein